MDRTRLYDIRLSRLPVSVGLCQADIPGIARIVNSAERRLLLCKEAGDEGFWGGWAEIQFNLSRDQPYVTLPRSVARLEFASVCDHPVWVENQFYEYLRFGNGRMPKQFLRDFPGCWDLRAYSRNNTPLWKDLTNTPQFIAAFYSDPGDIGKRVLIQGFDGNGVRVYTQDNLNRVAGVFMTLQAPFVQSDRTFTFIEGVQKDVTIGAIQLFQVDPNNGAMLPILTMEPSEQTASYRRYFFDRLPRTCCLPNAVGNPCQLNSSGNGIIPITAIAKMEFIPVTVDTDYVVPYGNIEALTEEALSVRYSQIDTAAAKAMSIEHHAMAVSFLKGELTHYLGRDLPAVDFRPFGSARLERDRIGILI
jgi:hypothetical protein